MHAAHHVVGRRGNRDVFLFDIDTVLLARSRDHRELFRRMVDDRRVEPDVVHAAVLHLFENTARHDVARRELGHRVIARHEALALAAPEQRACAAHGLGNQEVRAAIERERRRMELHELHVHDLGPRAERQRDAAARRALGIRRLAVEAPDAARREHRRGRAQHDFFAIEQRDRTKAAPVLHEEIDDIAVLERPHVFLFRHNRIERPRDLGARRIAMRMHDAVAAMAALTPERKRPIRQAVKLRAVVGEFCHILRPLRHDDARDVAVRQPRARDERVLEVQRRIVIRAKRRRDAALRLRRVAVLERITHGEQHMLPRLREPPGRRKARDARADDEHVRLIGRQSARIEIHQVTLHDFCFLHFPVIASIFSRAATDFSRTSCGTTTLGSSVFNASRTFSSVVFFIFGQSRCRAARWKCLPGQRVSSS